MALGGFQPAEAVVQGEGILALQSHLQGLRSASGLEALQEAQALGAELVSGLWPFLDKK